MGELQEPSGSVRDRFQEPGGVAAPVRVCCEALPEAPRVPAPLSMVQGVQLALDTKSLVSDSQRLLPKTLPT